jgi:hypothetical protein
VPIRKKGNTLERWEVAIIKTMLQRGGYNDQDILAYFTRPTRSVNHRAIAEIRTEKKHKALKAAREAELNDFLPLIGPEATVVAVRDRMQDTMLLHFACHGEFYRDRDPVALCLADGVLSARDILSCRLSAKLVVLSACWSGVASKAAREEYFGLAEAFLIAGVESVVVALWEVDDEVSSEFFKEFYLRWQKGLVAADALKDAMEVISAQPQWSHPHWWGPFVTRGFAAHRSSPAAIGCE